MESDLKPSVKSTISSDKGSIYDVRFSPDQKTLCFAGRGKKLFLTNIQRKTDNITYKVFTGHEGSIFELDFSSNGNFLASASRDETIRIWNVKSENGNSIKLEGHSQVVWCVRYLHKDPMKVISGSSDKTIKIWDIERKKEISTLLVEDCEAIVRSVDILPDNQTIVSGEKGKMRIWDFRSGKCVKILDHHKNYVDSVQFHPNTFSLASGSGDKTIKIFDFRTFQLLQSCQEHTDWVTSVCFHPSGKYILSGSTDSYVLVFDLSQKKVLYSLNEHSISVESVQFSPDGKLFASASGDDRVLLWNFPLGRIMIRDDRDIDEEERVKYLIQPVSGEDREDCCERNVLKIRIDNFFSLYSYKIFL